ncbi:MAG: diaminopropionate ammonia-lyase [Gudongella sp.]|jgi:diaminopropionate ammonia-lyase|nr:diaminopropionate ammonia-lyase [Gudongella sp.]
MVENFKIASLKNKSYSSDYLQIMNEQVAKDVMQFHNSFPMYKKTPLRNMENLAAELGLGGVYVKDESYRFGLNAFKVLGGSFAIGNVLAEKLGKSIAQMTYNELVSDDTRKELGEMVFVTATDGNHGRGVAWTANQLKQRSVVLMPKGSSLERLENIRKEGSDASIIDGNYDDAVRMANSLAEKNGWVMVQDTAWEGYEDIPTWIIQGYSTMGYEAYEELLEFGVKRPTHIFLQAGVGSMAAAVAGLFSSIYGDEKPIITVVEPNKADCIYRTAEADDGQLRIVTGDMDTIMAGLACGEPCTIGWDILKNTAEHFISCPDYTAAKGMRMLGNPMGEDIRLISGESGAAAFGCVAEIMTNDNLGWMRKELKLDINSHVLFFSTEGDTDKKGYKDIVWDGKYSG